MQQNWNASQIAQSNGAYGGKTITFIHPDQPNTLVTGVLRRAGSSSETPGNVLLLVDGTENASKGSDWFSVPGNAEVEVAA
jgi:hypothetical protein